MDNTGDLASKTNYCLKTPNPDKLGKLIASVSDEFNDTLGSQWSWVREPAAGTYSISGQTLGGSGFVAEFDYVRVYKLR